MKAVFFENRQNDYTAMPESAGGISKQNHTSLDLYLPPPESANSRNYDSSDRSFPPPNENYLISKNDTYKRQLMAYGMEGGNLK